MTIEFLFKVKMVNFIEIYQIEKIDLILYKS